MEISSAQRLAAASPGYSAASKDGEIVALVDRTVRPKIVVHNARTNTTHTLQPHHAGARWLSVSPDGRLLATSTWHGVDVKIWDTATGQLLKTLPADRARVLFSPDGQQLVVNEFGHLTVWRVSDWQPLHPRAEKSVSAVPGPIAYSPDSRWLAILDTPCRIRLLDAATHAELATFKLDSERFIDSLIFDPQGTRLIAGTYAPGSIHIWDLPLIGRKLSALGLPWSYAPISNRDPIKQIPVSVKLDVTLANSTAGD
jgi:WD40 repeat protein